MPKVIYALFGAILFTSFFYSPAFASSQDISCVEWYRYGSGTSSCVGSTITWTGGDNFYFDGPVGSPASGFSISPSTVYYIVVSSPSGAGTGQIAIINHDGSLENDVDYTVGGGTQNINITSPILTLSTFQVGIKSNNGGPNSNGVTDSFCISDVSFAECTGGGGPGGGSTAIEDAARSSFEGLTGFSYDYLNEFAKANLLMVGGLSSGFLTGLLPHIIFIIVIVMTISIIMLGFKLWRI